MGKLKKNFLFAIALLFIGNSQTRAESNDFDIVGYSGIALGISGLATAPTWHYFDVRARRDLLDDLQAIASPERSQSFRVGKNKQIDKEALNRFIEARKSELQQHFGAKAADKMRASITLAAPHELMFVPNYQTNLTIQELQAYIRNNPDADIRAINLGNSRIVEKLQYESAKAPRVVNPKILWFGGLVGALPLLSGGSILLLSESPKNVSELIKAGAPPKSNLLPTEDPNQTSGN